MRFLAGIFVLLLLVVPAGYAEPDALAPSGPITINRGTDVVIENLKISSTTGDCISIRDSVNVLIINSEIGPCNGHGIRITRSNGVSVYDNYIHPEAPPSPCCDRANGVWVDRSGMVKIQGNVIAFGQSNVQIHAGSDIWVYGNYSFNPRNTSNGSRGHHVQAWGDSQRVTVSDNFLRSSYDPAVHPLTAQQEDAINFGQTDGAVAMRNYITGGRSPSGCGIIVDWGTQRAQILDNTLLHTGQCGIGVSSGQGHDVSRNRVYNMQPVPGGGNTAIYVWKVSPESPACGNVRITGNIATQVKADGYESAFWSGGGCEPLTVADNIFDVPARARLEPIAETMPTPAIPPRPFRCAAISPFSTRTGCGKAPGATAVEEEQQ